MDIKDYRFLFFNTKSQFEEVKNDISKDAIVFIKDALILYTHGTYFKFSDIEEIQRLIQACADLSYEYTSSIDEEINAEGIGIADRVQTLEEQVAFDGAFEVENNPENVVGGNGKITSANAVAGAIRANGIPLHLTQEQYDALSESEKNNGNWYFIAED